MVAVFRPHRMSAGNMSYSLNQGEGHQPQLGEATTGAADTVFCCGSALKHACKVEEKLREGNVFNKVYEYHC